MHRETIDDHMSEPNAKTFCLSYGSLQSTSTRSITKDQVIDIQKAYHAMELGHKVCKLMLLKRWDPSFKWLSYCCETRQLLLHKGESPAKLGKPRRLDLLLVKEVQTLDFKLNGIKLQDKWMRDKEIRQLDPSKILVVSYGASFVLHYWILLFESAEICQLWCQGLSHLKIDTILARYPLVVERWIRKQFYHLTLSDHVAMKHMKPFVQTVLQYKASAKQLLDLCEEEMSLDSFIYAYKSFLHSNNSFFERFNTYSNGEACVNLIDFHRFLNDAQHDRLGRSRDRVERFMRHYLGYMDPSRNTPEPHFTASEFCDFLFSRENTVWDPVNDKVVHDMTRPLSHYWIASSHNTYLTGDQLKSESSVDAYARALLMGCRCIELDCWDGQKRGPNDFVDIVIYHGYTMTSKISLRDVLFTIRHYAFINSEYPVILSIEDNCSVSAQRLLAQELKEILGDLLLVVPLSPNEKCLPSPAALKGKILLKHKKLPIAKCDATTTSAVDDCQDSDILSRECVKRGVLYVKDNSLGEWSRRVCILFADKLCYMLDEYDHTDNEFVNGNEENTENSCDDESQDECSSLSGFGVKPEEMHVTEEWFHGKIDRDVARARLLHHKDLGNGLFLVRDSTLFIGDYSLSFLHEGQVHHCRIRTRMLNGEKKYCFLENKQMDTLYELISFYTKEKLRTPYFYTTLTIPCPQPCPHIDMPWFCEKATKQRAEELLNAVDVDGAFLIRHSGSDKNVFVLSLRVDGDIWHYRLKRDGRIFVVNQTVFENLCQIVDFYSSREFVKGVCLKYPVNEDNMGQYADRIVNEDAKPGCYMDLNDLEHETEVLVRAVEPYHAMNSCELSFPSNAIISVFRRDGDRLRGKYDSQTGLFPARCVVEIDPREVSSNGAVNHVSIELVGSCVEKASLKECDRPFAFKIRLNSSRLDDTVFFMAANSNDDCDDWLNTLNELMRSATDRDQNLRSREKSMRIATELSNLVIYCQAVPFNPNFAAAENFCEMCSFSESKHEKLVEKGLIQFNIRQLSRVYPMGTRVTSSNYDPIPMWNSGCHMVALNYQTGDRAMQLNQGRFLANGQCGYVLKPAYMMDEAFAPNDISKISSSCPVHLSIQIIGGRHLSRKDKNKGICSPVVQVDIIGLPDDTRTAKTHAITSNGLNPIWNEQLSFDIHCPEAALLRFSVEDGDFVGPKTDPFIGQAVFPIDCIRTGYRSVPLRNRYSEELELASLLIFVGLSRIRDEYEPFDPHFALQAGRTVRNTQYNVSSQGMFLPRIKPCERNSCTPPASPLIRSHRVFGHSSSSVESSESTSYRDGSAKAKNWRRFFGLGSRSRE
ncbi:hypothetical protein AB6A40_000644 [Gnathostoma spinigerum]|uniref:Phosphoinositide phospholipase C n=1 Tax=Gnathostoma spinigerum TaxID=75299 RepID=A0ABD6ECA8_9BILA